MKILRKIYAWLNAEDIRGEMGIGILFLFIRWGALISILLITLMCLIIN